MGATGSVQQDGYLGQADPVVPSDIYNALSFLVDQALNKVWTATLCQVKAVHGGGVSDKPPTVDVQPLVSQIDGYGNGIPHGTIYGLQSLRVGGANGSVVIDPAAGDIGLLLSANRDISAAINAAGPALPGSWRTFDAADSIYVGGVLTGAPTRYLKIDENGISLTFSSTVSLTINSTGVSITVGAMTFAITSSGFTFNGLDYLTHTHAVSTAPGETGPVTG